MLEVRVEVNGEPRQASVVDRCSLADLLRHEFGLTGTHIGCEQGVCGACTVLLNGAPVRSCLVLAAQAEGQSVFTVEGLSEVGGELHPLQTLFADESALQCGFCTPGFLVLLLAFFEDEHNSKASDHDVERLVASNICRCTGYQGIIAAAKRYRDSLWSTAPLGDDT